MRRLSTLMLIAVAMVLLMSGSNVFAAKSETSKLTPVLRSIIQNVSAGNTTDMMQAALTRQLFKENAIFDPRWNSSGQIQVDIFYGTEGTFPDVSSLKTLGATNIHVTSLMNVVEAWVPADKLSNVASLTWVQHIAVPQYAFTNGVMPVSPQPRTGSVDSQGDTVMGASAFRSATGDTGQGITVGVISAGDSGVSQSQSTGDLPTGVWQDPNYPGIADGEGTAMMEIVHDLAPGSNLAFCGPQTSAEFVNCLSDLQQQGSQIIVDDLAYPVTAYFTDDSDVTAVQQWQSQHSSVRLVTAAGNYATSFWSGNYNGIAINPLTINGVTYNEAQNFGTSTNPNLYETITVPPSTQMGYILEWADPWVPTASITSSTPDDPNDYDTVLYDSNFNILACTQGSTIDNNGCSQTGGSTSTSPGVNPVVSDLWTNTSGSTVTVQLAIFKRTGTPSTTLKLFIGSPDSCQIIISPVTPAGSIIDHSTLPYPAEISVGAINASSALQGTYALETYSSEGYVNLPLLSNSQIQKPDIVGVDGVSISGAGGFPPAICGSPAPNPPVFYGTSAAAPHVAALIALLESAGYTSSQVYNVLTQNAMPLSNSNYSNGSGDPNGLFGYGLADVKSVKAAGSSGGGGSSGGSSGGSGGGGGGGLGFLGLVILVACARFRFNRNKT